MTRLDTDRGPGGWANAADAAPSLSPLRAEPVSRLGAPRIDRLSQVIDELFAIKTPNVEWLERAGPIAARLNEEARGD